MIDHWDRVGDWSQQWLNLRYVTRFLARVGDEHALTLHRALVDAGKGSPLSNDEVDLSSAGDSDNLTGADAVTLARSTLQRYS